MKLLAPVDVVVPSALNIKEVAANTRATPVNMANKIIIGKINPRELATTVSLSANGSSIVDS